MTPPPPVPTSEQLVHIKRAREAALLRRWTSGRKLTPAEMSEIQHLLPPGLLANPPIPDPAYQHRYGHYATALDCDVRNIKRYVRIGREAKPEPDLPPFDDPPRFLDWWRKHMKHEPNERVLAYARVSSAGNGAASATPSPTGSASAIPGATAAGGTPPPGAPQSGARSGKEEAEREVLGFTFGGVGGFEASVIELRATTKATQTRLRTAMTAVPLDEGLVATCTLAVSKQLDLLRKAENDLFEMQQKRGELIPRTEVREDWRVLLAAMRQMRERQAANVVAALSIGGAFTPEMLEQVRAAVNAERLREDQLLRGSMFWRQSPDASSRTAA